MKYLKSAYIALAAICVFTAAQAYSQEGPAAAKAPEAQAAMGEEATEPKDLSIYGEVQAVNVQAGTMTVQYYDYDSDEEKNMDVAVDKDTKLENAKDLNDVRKGDWVDVTYAVSGGKNLAKSVSVEKEEEPEPEPAPAPAPAQKTP